MSTLSDAFHKFLNTIKADISSVFETAKTAFEGVVTDTLAALQTDIAAAGPEVLQIITSAVLATATGGASAFAPAMSAALVAVEQQGLVVAEHVVSGIVSSVIAHLPTPSIPAAAPAPVPSTASPVAQANPVS